MLNFLYTDERGISVPLAYEVITKTEEVWNDKYQKNTNLNLQKMK